ncbi:MAG: SDR family NAD(P)-dependent oxidoreductase, partial [Desulfofustis sp.]
MTEFNNKTAIVTGATRGIGRAITESLLQKGCSVIGLYGANHGEAKRFQDRWKDGQLQLHCCSVADHDQVKQLYNEIEARYDTLDILINNAGIRRDAIVALMDPEQWQQVLDTNLSGTFNMSKYAIPLMMKQKYGRIV